MSYKKTQSYKELRADWRWIHAMDPEAAAAAELWVEEHPEEWKELEHVLYYSEANIRKCVSLNSLEGTEMKQPGSCNREAFLPEEVRNAIYDDHRWFDRAKYLPEGSDEDPLIYVSKELAEGLHELSELQREVLFRTVINGESTESVARDKQCSSRNIRDIRARALRQLKSKITKHEGSGTPAVLLIVFVGLLAAHFGMELLTKHLPPAPPWLQYVGGAIAVILCAVLFRRSRNRETENLLRQHWARLNGEKRHG